MRSQLLLFIIVIMTISIHTYPFLRKLTDTKDSCTKAGKDYEEIPAQCKAGDKIYNVTKKEECQSGKWKALDSPKCSLESITKQSDCTGTPVYTAAVKGPNTCIKGSVDISRLAQDEATCKVTLSWTPGSCSIEGVGQEDCSGELTFTPATTDGEGNITAAATCKTAKGTDITDKAGDANTCKGTLTWTNGKCNVKEIEDETLCSGTPTFQEGEITSNAKCTLGKTEITDEDRLKDETSCETPLTWLTSTCEGSKAVTIEAICESTDPQFTAATGKCVDKASSNSNSFLSFKFALVLVVYLLF